MEPEKAVKREALLSPARSRSSPSFLSSLLVFLALTLAGLFLAPRPAQALPCSAETRVWGSGAPAASQSPCRSASIQHHVWLLRLKVRQTASGIRVFLWPDPIWPEGGTNAYAYVSEQPTRFIDPLGLGELYVGAGPHGGDVVVHPSATGGETVSGDVDAMYAEYLQLLAGRHGDRKAIVQALLQIFEDYGINLKWDKFAAMRRIAATEDLQYAKQQEKCYAGLLQLPAGFAMLGAGILATSRPPNLTPPGAGRRGALRQALRNNGIPTSQQPEETLPNYDKRGNLQPGRVYRYRVPQTGGGFKEIDIRDDAAGHAFGPNEPQNRGPHFNDPQGGHYDY